MKSRIVIINLTILIIFLLIYIINIKVKAKSLIITNNQEYNFQFTGFNRLMSILGAKTRVHSLAFRSNSTISYLNWIA